MMKHFFAISLTALLFSCGPAVKPEAELVTDFKHKKEVFDFDFNSNKIDKIKSQGDSIVIVADQIIEAYPEAKDMPEVLYGVAEVYEKMENFNKSIEFYSKFVEKYPKHEKAAYALYISGYQYELLKNVEKAIEVLQNVRKNYPESDYADLAKNKIIDLRNNQAQEKEMEQAKHLYDSLEATINK